MTDELRNENLRLSPTIPGQIDILTEEVDSDGNEVFKPFVTFHEPDTVRLATYAANFMLGTGITVGSSMAMSLSGIDKTISEFAFEDTLRSADKMFMGIYGHMGIDPSEGL
jgi:hypothetical protein